MRTAQIVARGGLILAAAAALPLSVASSAAPASPVSAPAVNGSTGITVVSTGSTVQASTLACSGGGNASLLAPGEVTFAQGRQTPLSTGSGGMRTAFWSSVSEGTFRVVIVCSDGTTAGTQTVTVGGSSTATPTASASPVPTTTGTPTTQATSTATTSSTVSPALGVRGGLGGGSHDYGTLTLAVGSTLVAGAVGGGAWYLRRRAARGRM